MKISSQKLEQARVENLRDIEKAEKLMEKENRIQMSVPYETENTIAIRAYYRSVYEIKERINNAKLLECGNYEF